MPRLVEERVQPFGQRGVVRRDYRQPAQLEVFDRLDQRTGRGDRVLGAGLADRVAQGSLVVEALDETSRRAQIGHDLGLDVQDVARRRHEVSSLGHEFGHLQADGHGFVRRARQMEAHLERSPSPQFSFERQVERGDNADSPLRDRPLEFGNVQFQHQASPSFRPRPSIIRLLTIIRVTHTVST